MQRQDGGLFWSVGEEYDRYLVVLWWYLLREEGIFSQKVKLENMVIYGFMSC